MDITLLNVISILPLVFMTYIQFFHVAVPSFKASTDERMELNTRLNKENCLDGVIGVADCIVCLWWISSLVYVHNYNVDNWHNAEAFWTLKLVAVVWLVAWVHKKGFIGSSKKESNKE